MIYNYIVCFLIRSRRDKGIMSFIVSIGVLVTLLAAHKLGPGYSLEWTIACFAASGTPMIAGSIYRHYNGTARRTRATCHVLRTILTEIGKWQKNE